MVRPPQVAAILVVFFLLTFPANNAMRHWTPLPDGWESLGRQGECSHAIGAILCFAALALLVISVISARR